ncbi:SDR family NAD(P)-dependent oxidoreductase [Cohnella sp. JJ-181]|uniref:SDR family NAD(P)-dependent oxidoreductase n=1 Tax=Cohnella rhizoplanae TaxID=2974897 RepID=UPI0022FF7CC6|nr:SDR family NAD(P)-dependent oxidoreductase [Cohnella sp. JJ-181]CAI6069558.1 3-phenylpropionate-dihydrodiol/cinnamic acid-dihydrodiol dehydrogenase [Cohnella sp. JJ-181]
MNVLITGAGRGLGFELAKLAAARGHAVAACVRDIGRVGDGLAELAERYRGLVRIETLDVSDETQARALAAKLRDDGFAIDALVSNAGVLLGRGEGIASLELDDLKRTFEVNLYGPLIVAKHLTPLMRESRSGAEIVVHVGSDAGSFAGAYGGDYPYALSKIALSMFTKQLNEELKPRGIRALAVHPGWIRTDMGGQSAPLSPAESALGIIDLIEGTTAVPAETWFVDYAGRAMPV